jgi:hypothetical protein
MKRKRHSPEQIIRKLREAEGMLSAEKTIGQVCQALEVSEQSRRITAGATSTAG